MSHKHYDDTGRDIVHMYAQRGSGASHDSNINQSMAYIHGNAQYPIYQSFPLATNQGPVDYQYAPQVMVPIPIIVGQEQIPPVQKEDTRRNKRESTDLDYFLSRGGKHKERRYRSRSRSKSIGELSASPSRESQKKSYRSRSKSVGKIPSNPFRKDRSKVGSDDEDKRPKNPFRRRKSKSPSLKRHSGSHSRKSRQRSRSRERSSENRFRKRRHDSRERSSKRYRRQETPPKPRPSRSSREYRKPESRDKRNSDDLDRRVIKSRNKPRVYSNERNLREGSESRHSPYIEKVSRAGSKVSRESYNRLEVEWSPVSASRSRYKDDFDNDDQESGQLESFDDYTQINEQTDFDRHSVLSEQFQYERERNRSRQNYSPLSDETHMSDGVGLKIHVSNRGRWIENENIAMSGSSRKTRLMEDGILVEASREKFNRETNRSYNTKQSNSGRVRYIEDGVEVFYGDKSKTARSYNPPVGMEDVSDSESYDSQKDYKSVRTVRNVSQNRDVDFQVHRSGNMGPRDVGYIDDNSFKQRKSVYHPSDRLRVPNICIDYNLDKRTCGNECRYLHLCKFFILGICNYGDQCKKNHDIFAFQSFNLLRKQNPNFERTQESCDKVKEMLFARFKRNKKNVSLPDNAVNIQRSPSVESIVSFETVESIQSVESIDSFDARYYTADAANLKTKKKEKSSEEQSEKDSKKELENRNDNDSVSIKSENKAEIAVDKIHTENEGNKNKNKSEKENESDKLLIKVEIENEKLANDGIKKQKDESKTENNENQEEKPEKIQSDKSKITSNKDETAEKAGKSEKAENNCEFQIKIEIDESSDKPKEVKNEKCDKEESRSLSPVSVENIEDWDTMDRYERISEGGLSDGEKVEIAIDDEDLESVSSNESNDETEKALGIGSDIVNKVAVPIGMNDPLVFNKPNSSGDKTSESQTASLPNPNILVPPPQPAIFPPPVNFNVPPPLLPPRAPLMTSNAQLPVRPLFPIISSQNDPKPIRGASNPLQQIPSGFSNQHPIAPNLRHTMPPSLLPPQGMFVPNVQMSNPPPLLPLSHLPTPDVMKEVIQTLSEKSDNAKTESKKVTNADKKAVVAAKDSKKKEVKRVDPDLKEPLKRLWQFPHKALINMGIIEFVTETEAYKDEMIAEIVKLLININLPYVTLKKLMSVIKEKIQINIRTPIDMRKILELYPDNFQIVETVDSDNDSDDEGEVKKNVQIKSRVKLGFCSKHGYLPFYLGKCDCKQLHLCKFYFLSNCPNMNCKFGHKLKTEHNLNTFKHHRLHRMTGEEIMEFFRDIDSRNIETVPGVCRFYNSSKSREPGCYKGNVTDYQDICHNLHLCFYFVKGNCQVQDCQRSHNIRDKQPLSLLQKFGLDPDEIGEEKIMNLINLKTVDVKKKKEEKAEQFQSSRQVSPEEFKKSTEVRSKVQQKVSPPDTGNKTAKPVKQNKKPGVKFPSVCKFFNNSSGCKKKDWGAAGFCLFLHVCQKYVNGQCKIGEKCKRPHTFFSGEPAALITRYGIDLTRLSEQEILDTLNENANALSDLPLIGDDEDSEEEESENKTGQKVDQTPANDQLGKGRGQDQKSNYVRSQRPNQSLKLHGPKFSSHSIDEVLKHIMKEGGNKT